MKSSCSAERLFHTLMAAALPDPPWGLGRLDAVQALGDRLQPDGTVAGMAQPEGVDGVGDDQVERTPGRRIELPQRLGRVVGLGMVERFQHQLAAAALAGLRPQRAAAVEHRCHHPVIVDAEPGAACQHVAPGADMRAVRPVPGRGQGRPARELVAVGGEDQPIEIAEQVVDRANGYTAEIGNRARLHVVEPALLHKLADDVRFVHITHDH